MGSKESFATFPCMLLLYDYVFISRQDLGKVTGNWRLHLPGFASLAYVAFLYLSHSKYPSAYGEPLATPFQYLMTQFNVHMTYVRLIFLPMGQNADYGYPVAGGLLEIRTLLSFAGYAGLWALGAGLIRKRPALSFSMLWFMITLTPDSSIVPLVNMIFEHRLYLPLAGLFPGLVLCLFEMPGRVGKVREAARAYMAAALVLAVAVLGVSAYSRNMVWADWFTMYGDLIRKTPAKFRVNINLARAYSYAGEHEKALHYYQSAVNLDSTREVGWYALGNAYMKLEDTEMAITSYRSALNLNPDFVEAHNNIGIAYLNAERLEEAIRHFEASLMLRPGIAQGHLNLAIAYQAAGQEDEAKRHFIMARELKAGDRG
jgi:tetratricopeptide (TPR) repeat protein